MDQASVWLSDKWLERFGCSPPEWVGLQEELQDIETAINACQRRIEELNKRLQKEEFLLAWLQEKQSDRGQNIHTSKEEAAKSLSGIDKADISQVEETVVSVSQEPPLIGDLSDSSLRRRVFEHVDRRDEKLARRVKRKIQGTKHWSSAEIETIFDFEEEERKASPIREEANTRSHKLVSRKRSMSDSSLGRPLQERLSVSPDQERLGTIVDVESPTGNSPNQLTIQDISQVLQHKSELRPYLVHPHNHMDIPGKETKRLSNGGGIHDHDSDDEHELLSSIKTVVASSDSHAHDSLPIHGSFPSNEKRWMEESSTLTRDLYFTPADEDGVATGGTGERTPTEENVEAALTIAMVNKAQNLSLNLGLEFGHAGSIFQNEKEEENEQYEQSDDEEDDIQSEDQEAETGSINDIETSAYHNLAESTLTYILRDTIFASRSNSMSSLSDSRRSLSPEPTTPSGVNLRPNSNKREKRNRAAQVLENQFSDNLEDEERLQQMLAEIQDSSPYHSHSPSSDLSHSDPSSPTHFIPYDMSIRQSLSARSSRIYPVRRDTVVVHGEVLVIRKLVVAGIVTAEKAYLDCLQVTKEYYRKPLLALTSTTQPIISERDVNTIFYRVEDLHTLHSTLHERLESLLPDWGIHSCVGDFFLDLCKNLKLYKDYVEMYRRSLDCLERSKQDPNFKKFLDDVRVTVSSQFKDVPNVNELLRKPIERLQSYSLVLTDLCQHTPENHPDFSVLKQSLNVMSDFIASTHDPRAFQQLSGGFNRELVKQELAVELIERSRKIRRLFLFHDVLISAKEKSVKHGEGVKLEPKWYLPLHDLRFQPTDPEALRPVPVTSDQELGVIKSRIAELKAQLNRDNKEKERRGSTLDKDASFKRNFKFIGTKPEKLRKKLQEQQVSYWVASPSLPLRLFSTNGKRYVFLLHNEDEREQWISAIKKLQPKAVQSVSLSQFELQDLLCRQKVHLTREQDEVIEVQTDEDDYLTGILRVHVTSAKDIKTKQIALHCGLEFDEYSRFDRKARTLPVNMDLTTLSAIWDQDFEIEIAGAHMIKVIIFSKYLLKEEVFAAGKIKLPVKELKSSKRCKVEVPLHPQGVATLVLEFFTSLASMGKRPALLSSGVFGFPMETVAKRERHDIPLIVQTCVDEVEKRGLSEVGIYRVAGVLRDVQELRMAFDSDYIHAQQLASETDIHAVAGLLKRYFRELPDPLFTDELYMSFVQALALSDPEAREQSLVTLFHSLPLVNFKTAVFLFKHLRNVAANADANKMNLNNLATLFGPNLLRPGSNQTAAAFDVMSPVNILMFVLTCPIEFYDEPSFGGSAPNSASKASKKRSKLLSPDDDSTSLSSTQSTGFITPSCSSALSPVPITSPTSPSPLPSSSPGHLSSSNISSTNPATSSGPSRFKQSII